MTERIIKLLPCKNMKHLNPLHCYAKIKIIWHFFAAATITYIRKLNTNFKNI